MAEDKKSLEELMELAQQGDELCYNRLLGEVSVIIRGFLIRRIPGSNDIEDVLQEILISVHNARHTYDKSRPFKPWLFSIAKFRLYDHFRKIYRKQDNESAVFDEIVQEFYDGDVTTVDDRSEKLYEEIDKLPKKQRKIIQLMKIEGYTAKEVGSQLNMSESAVKVSAHRTYKTLKSKFSDSK